VLGWECPCGIVGGLEPYGNFARLASAAMRAVNAVAWTFG